MSLQAISLTRKYQSHRDEDKLVHRADHQASEAKVSTASLSEEYLHQLTKKPPKHQVIHLGGAGEQEQLSRRVSEEGNSEVIDLTPTVSQSKLNKHGPTASANSRIISRNSNELDNISSFIQTNTAKAEHRELKSLEIRLRDYHGNVSKVESANNDSVSDRQSKMTHL